MLTGLETLVVADYFRLGGRVVNVYCIGDVRISFVVRSLLRAGVQPTLDPALRPLCRSNAPAQGEKGNW